MNTAISEADLGITDEQAEPEVEHGGRWHVKRNRREMRILGRRRSAGTGGRERRQAATALRAAVRSIWDAK